MKPILIPYLLLGGRTKEAIEFYKTVFDFDVEFLMHFSEMPEPAPPGQLAENWDDKVMHTSWSIGGNQVYASDGMNPNSVSTNFMLSYAMETEAQAHETFIKLADEGTIIMPMSKTFWSSCFGMVTDKFGVDWMITIQEPEQ